MKHLSLIITLFCLFSSLIKAQVYDEGYSYEKRLYFDNLDEHLIPKVFHELYYNKIAKQARKRGAIICTNYTQNKLTVCNFQSKAAKEGYLFINNYVMMKVDSQEWSDKMTISYVYNGKEVCTKKDIMRVVRMKRKDTDVFYHYDTKTEKLTITIKPKNSSMLRREFTPSRNDS